MGTNKDQYESYWDAMHREYLKDAKPYVAQITHSGGDETIDMGRLLDPIAVLKEIWRSKQTGEPFVYCARDEHGEHYVLLNMNNISSIILVEVK